MMEIIAKVRQIINPPYLRGDYLKIFGTLVILLAIPLTVFVTLQARGLRSRAAQLLSGAPSVQSIVEPGSMVTEASYIIFIDGTNYYARNGKTGEIQFSGSDACVVIQSAKNALPSSGGTLQLTEGTFNCAVTDATPGIGFGGNITLAGASMGATTINITAHSRWGPDIYVDGNFNVLRDLTVNGAGTSATNVELSIMVVGSDNTLLRVRSRNSSPIRIDNDVFSSNIRIEGPGARNKSIDCVSEGGLASDPNSGGFFVYHATGVYIENLYSHDNAMNGLVLFPDEGDTITVVNYHSENEGRSGIFFIPTSGRSRLAEHIQIVNPTIRRAGGMGIDGSSMNSLPYAPITITGGIVERSASNNIDLGGGWGWQAIGTVSRLAGIKNFSITDPSKKEEGSGFTTGYAPKQIRLINVRAENNWDAGISIFGATDVTVDKCAVANNGIGSLSPIGGQSKGVFIFDQGSSPYSRNNTVRNCVFNDSQATAPKNLKASATAGQKTVRINSGDIVNFFSGQTVEIKDGVSEINYIDSLYIDPLDKSSAVLTMFINLERNYNANTATVQGKATQGSGIDEYSSSDYNLFENNSFENIAVPISIVGSHSQVRNNIGYATESSGTATIASGSTFVDVAHGLAKVPTRVILTPTTNTAGKGYWVSDKNVDGGTKFRISLSSSHTSELKFDWQALVE